MDIGFLQPAASAVAAVVRPAAQVMWKVQRAFPPLRSTWVFGAFTAPGPAGPPTGAGATDPYVAWLNSAGRTCAQWNAMSDVERRLFVATQRFKSYQMFLGGSLQVATFVAAVTAACSTVPVTIVYKTHPAGATATPVSLSARGQIDSFRAGGPFPSDLFFSTYISCADWMSMSFTRKQATLNGWFMSLLGGGSTRGQPGPAEPPGTPGLYLPYTVPIYVFGGDLNRAIREANAYCVAQSRQPPRVPPFSVSPHSTGQKSIPGLLQPVRPAKQAVAPAATSQVTVNSQCQLVDASTGVPVTDASGNPIQYQHSGRAREAIKSFLVIAAVIGIPAYFGSYYGARAGM